MIESTTRRSSESIRRALINSSFDAETNVLRRGENITDYYNQKNLRKRIILDQGKKIAWNYSETIFKPSKELLLKCQ